jgi:hypothetical protein
VRSDPQEQLAKEDQQGLVVQQDIAELKELVDRQDSKEQLEELVQ